MDPDRPGGKVPLALQLAAGEVGEVRREVARHGGVRWRIREQIAEVNGKICEARPIARTDAPPVPEGEKKGSSRRSQREKSAEIGRLEADAAQVAGLRG